MNISPLELDSQSVHDLVRAMAHHLAVKSSPVLKNAFRVDHQTDLNLLDWMMNRSYIRELTGPGENPKTYYMAGIVSALTLDSTVLTDLPHKLESVYDVLRSQYEDRKDKYRISFEELCKLVRLRPESTQTALLYLIELGLFGYNIIDGKVTVISVDEKILHATSAQKCVDNYKNLLRVPALTGTDRFIFRLRELIREIKHDLQIVESYADKEEYVLELAYDQKTLSIRISKCLIDDLNESYESIESGPAKKIMAAVKGVIHSQLKKAGVLETDEKSHFDSAPVRCQEQWPEDLPEKFDVAISFAGTERELAEHLADLVRNEGYKVFYDAYYEEQLWGKDLPVFFDEIYRKRSSYCVIFISQEYRDRMWTNHERKSAQARALKERGNEYILPVRVDDTELPGLQPTIGHIDISKGLEFIASALIKKLSSGSTTYEGIQTNQRTSGRKVKPEPYRSSSVRVDENPVTARLAANIGGISGPSLPRMVIRYEVPKYEGTGWEIVQLDDGRECLWTGKVSDGSIQECVLMAKKPLVRQPPPAVGYRRCYYCGKDNQVATVSNSDLVCGFCGQVSRHMA